MEQGWYWFDLAAGLRTLNRPQSLPHLLRCAEVASEVPLGHFFAAETVCFLGFTGYLRQPHTPLGRSALGVLLRAMEGLRFGVPPDRVVEARLGELVETVWDARSDEVDPLAVRVYAEALRFLRRSPHLGACLGGEQADQETFDWQVSRLAALEPALEDCLQEAVAPLCRLLPSADPARQKEILQALCDLRAEAAEAVLPLLAEPRYPHLELALEVLTWSKHPGVGPRLREWIRTGVPMVRRAQARRRSQPPRRPSLPDVPYRALLRALRGHPSPQTEAFLLLAARDWDPTIREAAVSSLGWWEPLERADVLLTLQESRRDPCRDVSRAARAALARLGERQSLLHFRQSLSSEDPQRVYDTIQTIAGEGLTLLWPDLDRLGDAEDSDLAHHAREALERMGEELEHGGH
jgi:hypothetical protein